MIGITKIDYFAPIVIIEMAVQCITSIAGPHLFCAAGDWVYLGPTTFRCLTICASNMLGIVK